MRSSVRRMYSSRVETRSPRVAESRVREAESSFMFCWCVRRQHVSCCDYLRYGTGPSGACGCSGVLEIGTEHGAASSSARGTYGARGECQHSGLPLTPRRPMAPVSTTPSTPRPLCVGSDQEAWALTLPHTGQSD